MDNSNNSDKNHQPQDPWQDFPWLRGFDWNRRPDYSNPGPRFPEGFPFDAASLGPWGRSWREHMRRCGPGRRHHHDGHHGRNDSGDEDSHGEETVNTDATMRNTPEDGGAHPPPPPPPQDPFRFHPFGPPRGRGGRCGRGGRRHRPPPPAYDGVFDFRPLAHVLSAHPLAQACHAWRNYADQHRASAADAAPQEEGQTQEQQDDTFVPPVDIFSIEKAYVLHVALPGVAKEDVSVSWDGDKVRIAGVAHRPGDEELLGTLVSAERKVGTFERSIKLPPPGCSDNEDVDSHGIVAKMENGILIVTVPTAEKDWTEVHEVEIE